MHDVSLQERLRYYFLTGIFHWRSQFRFIFVAICFALVPTVVYTLNQRGSYLEMQILLPVTSWTQLHFVTEKGIDQTDYRDKKIEGSSLPQSIHFSLKKSLKTLLFHIDRADAVSISQIKIFIKDEESPPVSIPVSDIPPSSNASSEIKNGELTFRARIGHDITFSIPLNNVTMKPFSVLSSARRYVESFMVFFPLFYVSILVVVAAYRIVEPRLPGFCRHNPGSDGLLFQPGTWSPAYILSFFLVILGARLWLINTYGSDLPFWDQWDGEAEKLYLPYFDGSLSLQHWFNGHNEHRILFTRVLALGLLLINGQWDNRLQMIANAVIISAVVSWLFSRIAPESRRVLWWCGCVMLFAFPVAPANTLWGFQSQFYFLIGFSIATIWYMTAFPMGAWQMYCGGLLGFAALFTMGSGLLASAAVIIVVLLDVCRGGSFAKFRQVIPVLVWCCCVVILGLAIKPTVVEHALLGSNSLKEFCHAVFIYSAWPFNFMPVWSIIQWAPFILFVIHYMKEPCENESVHRLIVGIGFWVLLQICAIAYARGVSEFGSRYLDVLCFGVIVNAYSINYLYNQCPVVGFRCFCYTVVSAVWIIGNIAAFTLITSINLSTSIPVMKEYQGARVDTVAEYVRTRQLDVLLNKSRWDIPLSDPLKLAGYIDNPEIQNILPASVRSDHKTGYLWSWLSLLLRAAPGMGIAGIGLFFYGIVRDARREQV